MAFSVYALTVDELAEKFLDWVLTNRGEKAHKERILGAAGTGTNCSRLRIGINC